MINHTGQDLGEHIEEYDPPVWLRLPEMQDKASKCERLLNI